MNFGVEYGNYPFENLEVWTESVKLLAKIFDIVEQFPTKEQNILTEQLKRATLSIKNNIAEGDAGSTRQFRAYLHIA